MDLLVKLYENFNEEQLKTIIIKKAISVEKFIVLDWVKKNFPNWLGEVDTSLSSVPSKCFLALKENKIIGFACYDSTAKGFFGPIGIIEEERKSGIGKALLLRTLNQMRSDGYVYAIIGWAGPIDFFKKNVNAIEIPDSNLGIYKDMLK